MHVETPYRASLPRVKTPKLGVSTKTKTNLNTNNHYETNKHKNKTAHHQ